MWQRLGKIFEVNKYSKDMWSHASLPVLKFLSDDVARIYFSSRNIDNKSQVFYLDYSFKSLEIVNVCESPFITYGDSWSRDGISLCSIVNDKYYCLGWNLDGQKLANRIGVVQFEGANCIFSRQVISLCNIENKSFGYPYVLYDEGRLVMYYDTNLVWNEVDAINSRYYLRSAESKNGEVWSKGYRNLIDFKSFNEDYASRPSVIKVRDKYWMWYSLKVDGNYVIRHAESVDGLNWERVDHLFHLNPSKKSDHWDSVDVCYPYVFKKNENIFMLYNGNGYGATGFGLAVLRYPK